MARDDYFVVACKILVFLYKRLKDKEKRSPEEYIIPMSRDFPITEDYLKYVVEKLSERGYVEKASIIKEWGGEIVSMDISDMQITPEGIAYLKENSIVSKLAMTMKEAAPIASLFV